MPFFDDTYTNARLIPAPPSLYRYLGVMVSQPWNQPYPDGTGQTRMVKVEIETVSPYCPTIATAVYCPVDNWPQQVLDNTAGIIADIDRLIGFLRAQRERLATANDQLARETMLKPAPHYEV